MKGMVRKVVFLFATDEISLGEWALPSHGRTQVRSGDPGDDLHHLEAQYGGCRTDIDPGNEHPHAGECSGSWSDPEGKARQTPVPSHSRQELVTWDPDEFSRKPRGGARIPPNRVVELGMQVQL